MNRLRDFFLFRWYIRYVGTQYINKGNIPELVVRLGQQANNTGLDWINANYKLCQPLTHSDNITQLKVSTTSAKCAKVRFVMSLSLRYLFSGVDNSSAQI
jgi:hypothetical protein